MLTSLLVTAMTCMPHSMQDGEVQEETTRVELTTREGQTMRGTLARAPADAIGLRSKDFADVLEVRPDTVASLRVLSSSDAEEALKASVLFNFKLTTGDRLHARIVATTPDLWTLDAPGIGQVTLSPSAIVSVDNLGGGDLIYYGPHGLAGWHQDGKIVFVSDADELVAPGATARIERKLGLDQARDIHLELAWEGPPRFRVGVGHAASRSARDKSVTLEAWGGSLVAWRDEGGSLEMAELMTGLAQDSHMSLDLSVTAEEVVFRDTAGTELGWVSRPNRIGERLSITNDGKQLSLRALRVLRGAAEAPPTRRDGAGILGFDPVEGVLTTAEGPVALHDVAGLDFAGHTEIEQPLADLFWLIYKDGRRVSGLFVRSSPKEWVIQPSWSDVPLTCTCSGLREIAADGLGDRTRVRRSSRSFLVTANGEVAGELESISPDGSIVWNPTIARSSATLDRGTVERVVINRTTAYFVSGRKYPHLLRLRSGDSFRCRLLSVGEDEVRFESPFGGEHTLENGRLKAIEFDVRAMDRFRKLFEEGEVDSNQDRFFGFNAEEIRRETSEGFDADSLDRALALPRKYKKRRFEHLILARSGDFLRTELVSWSAEKGVLYPGPLDGTRAIASDRIAAVIWLDEVGEGARPEHSARVILDERTQINLNLSGTEDGKLIGTSSVLGELRIDLAHVISLELDEEEIAAGTPYDDWVLRPMREPFPEEVTAPPGPGPAVGDPAPETLGHDLAGIEFSLEDYSGKVVLLEFWGHW